MSNLTGENFEIDSTIITSEGVLQFQEMKREQNIFVLWTCVPIGIIIFLTGLIIKRRKEGPDLFIDIENEEQEFFD